VSDIPQESVDRLMVKCARHCCICRRFRPTKLQVHHIVPRGDGGSDEDDNLVVICHMCHTDVHSQVPFARRFSVDELKGHRDALMQMVADRKLSANEADNTDQLIGAALKRESVVRNDDGLSREAIEILLAAAHSVGNRQGMIILSDTNVGLRIFPGQRQCPYDPADRRATARYKAAIKTLFYRRLIELSSRSQYEVTELGYLCADEIVSAHAQPVEPT
jgi:hypothetical protein